MPEAGALQSSHLEGLLNYNAGGCPELLIQQVLGGGARICISNTFPEDAHTAVQGLLLLQGGGRKWCSLGKGQEMLR